MIKKAFIAVALALVATIGFFRFSGLRIAPDGSGLWPRFVSQQPDYDALEADRARQRALAPATTSADAPSGSAKPAADQRPGDAASTSPGTSTSARTGTGIGTSASVRGYWPDFRGPNRDGRYDETLIRTHWPADVLTPIWKQRIGLGYASFVLADGRAFTIEQRRQQEVVAAYDVATGRELWTDGWVGEFIETMGGDGPRATPTYHDGRIYALGAEGELRVLDARTGSLVWRRNILTDARASNLQWGMSASPLLVDNNVIVLPGGPAGHSVAAYNKMTGEPVWTALDDQQAYTSPMLVTLGGVRQLLIVSATRAR